MLHKILVLYVSTSSRVFLLYRPLRGCVQNLRFQLMQRRWRVRHCFTAAATTRWWIEAHTVRICSICAQSSSTFSIRSFYKFIILWCEICSGFPISKLQSLRLHHTNFQGTLATFTDEVKKFLGFWLKFNFLGFCIPKVITTGIKSALL